MIRYLITLLVLIGAVWLGIKIQADPGLVLFSYKNSTMEMPLWFFLLASFFAFTFFYILLRLLDSPSRFNKIRKLKSKQHKVIKAHKKTNQGLLYLLEEDWAASEKMLIDGRKDNNLTAINYIAAAYAAQQLNSKVKRENYLRLAYQQNPDLELAIGIAQAKFQAKDNDYQSCLTTLKQLQRIDPRHKAILRLLKATYIELEDWNSLLLLIVPLKKRKVLSEIEAFKLQIQAYSHLLIITADDAKQHHIDELWQSIPKKLRREPELIIPYINFLVSQNHDEDALKLLLHSIKRHWDDRYLPLYAKINAPHATKQLTLAESWIANHPSNAILFHCLGTLAIRQQLWGKAKEYYVKSLELDHNAQVYFEYGQLLERQNDKKALKIFKDGLEYEICKTQQG